MKEGWACNGGRLRQEYRIVSYRDASSRHALQHARPRGHPCAARPSNRGPSGHEGHSATPGYLRASTARFLSTDAEDGTGREASEVKGSHVEDAHIRQQAACASDDRQRRLCVR